MSLFTLDELEQVLPAVPRVYASAFLPPPYRKAKAEIEAFAGEFPEHITREGFRFAGAAENGELAGFAYGYACVPGRWFHDLLAQRLPHLAEEGWLDACFQLAEIALDPLYQGKGIGGQLHDLLLQSVHYQRALLATFQAETAAGRLYERRGWAVLAHDFKVAGVPRIYQIMGLRLSA